LKQAFEAWQFYQKQLTQLDEQIRVHLEQMKQDRALPPLQPRRRTCGRQPNEPNFDVRAALYYVVGIDLTSWGSD
jgi:hypothetical protein